MWREAAPITTAGIYHNATLGLISLSSDGSNWITIADKNLGATQVYNGDVFNESTVGKYFQRGNNYAFPLTDAISNTSSDMINAGTYGPGNYYYSDVWRAIGDGRWDSSNNTDLWGGTTDTNDARQGPCGNGYHIPSDNDWSSLISIMTALGMPNYNTKAGWETYLYMPQSGYRGVNTSTIDQGTTGYYWSSDVYSTTNGNDMILSGPNYLGNNIKTTGHSIRPFANTPVQPDDSWEVLYEYHAPDYLCFTANTASSTVALTKNGNPTVVTLETSTDGSNWSAYTFGSTITLNNVGDKVYWRNTSETATGFSTYVNNNYYSFVMSGSISGSGDVNYLLCKNSTDTLSDYCFNRLFYGCTSLTTPPKLTATTLAQRCYNNMFHSCGLTSIPQLIALSYPDYACVAMFSSCANIKLSTTQTGEYQTPYRIPTEGTGTVGNLSLLDMFKYTGGTFTGDPSINTTYYTSNTVI